MMQDAVEDRTEAPTPRRLLEARRQGQVAVSRDLTAALGLAATAGALTLLGPWLLGGLTGALTRSLSSIHEMTPAGAIPAMRSAGASLLGIAAPLMVFAVLTGAGATLMQTGFLMTGETLRLNPERLNPFEGLRRAFSLRTFLGIAGGLAKGAVILGVLAACLWQDRETLAALSTRPLAEALPVLAGSGLSLLAKTAIALVALGLLDWSYRRWQHRRDLRMSRREIQDELREFEGDPAIRNRRRAHHQRLMEARFFAQVPSAAVVVTADDVAVALRLADEEPGIVALGQGADADRMREAALAAGVPILERTDLAIALSKKGTAGAPVPQGLREGAAEAISVARELKP
jgi:flagellar biosynthetic protein FlhB